MPAWIFLVSLLIFTALALYVWGRRAMRESRAAAARRAHAAASIRAEGDSGFLPLDAPRAASSKHPPNSASAKPAAPPAKAGPRSRTVMTPDGPMTLTAPPFRLRRSIMTRRERLYARFLTQRLPSGYVLASQVRLESLLTPTDPHGYSPEEFRTWRMRVRLRAVDFVVCSLPSWSPVVAIEVTDSPDETTTRDDRMTDEALGEVGLPLVRARRTPGEDWPLIESHLITDESDEDDAAFPDEPEAPPPDSLPFDRPAY